MCKFWLLFANKICAVATLLIYLVHVKHIFVTSCIDEESNTDEVMLNDKIKSLSFRERTHCCSEFSGLDIDIM